ncbi:MAG: EAL domain-containing protein [Sphingobium sp.]
MEDTSAVPLKSQSSKQFAAVTAILLLVAVLVMGVLVWPAKEVDRISEKRDAAILSLVLNQSVRRVAHTQESSTVWDDAVLELAKRPLDLEWVDQNLGIWFNEYAGHDEVYIVDGANRPIYVMRGGKRLKASAYDPVRSAIQPFVDRVRKQRDPVPATDSELAMLSPGSFGLDLINGKPAIISAKPIISDTGEIEQAPGSEAIHVSVVYLSPQFVGRLSNRYELTDGRYSPIADHRSFEAAIPLHSIDGRTIGYFIWRPFAPGQSVTSYIAPAVLVAMGLAGIAILFLTRRLGLRTLDLEASKAQAQHLALHDVLTGLPNRGMFERRLEQALEQSRYDGSQLALLYVDLDRFKQVNDSLGHPAGDALIQEVAERLTGMVRNSDTVARLGGDEFAIILANLNGTSIVSEIAARIVKDIARPFDLMGSQTFIGASVGVAISPDHGADRTELIRKADIALYKAKVDGRNQFMLFDPSLDEAVRVREEIGRDLRNAVADCERQLKVHYQPVFSARTGKMTSVEALLRWDHPERGLTSPAAFVSFAEESGLIEQLGEWVLITALRDAARWPGVRVSVNVSPIQIRNPLFARRVMELLGETGIQPEQLELELTETALMERSNEIADTLARLRKRGVRIALDDFGTGYSSLSHIRDIAVDRIKIDRSFVMAIENGNGQALIEAIVTLALANGMKLTAEGVETAEQRDFLKRVGCDELQGFLLSHPIAAEKIDRLYLDEQAAGAAAQIKAA